MNYTYNVTLTETPEGPDAALRERLAKVAAYRLETLHEREHYYPKAEDFFDMLDNMQGPFLWEMSDEELEKNPPSRIDFKVLNVNPISPPATDSTINVEVTIEF